MPGGVEIAQVAEQEPGRVAEAAVCVRNAREDVRGNAHLAPVVGGHHPQPEHVRAQLVHHVARIHHVAPRLGLLAALLVHGEPVRQHGAVRCAAVDGHGGQQGRLEPAAVLVGALHVEVGGVVDLRVFRAHAAMHQPGIHPHVHHVRDLAVAIGLVSKQFGRVQREPRLDALVVHPFGDLRHEPRRVPVRLAGIPVHQKRQRHAPGAAARNAPVRAGLDHSRDALLGPARIPVDFPDRAGGLVAQSFPVQAHEPLRRRGKQQRTMVPPAVRIAVPVAFPAKQHAALRQQVRNALVGLFHMQPAHQAGVLQKMAVDAERIAHRKTRLAAGRKVVQSVRGRRMHRAGARFQRDVVGGQHRRQAVVEGVPQVHAGQLRAFQRGQLARAAGAVALKGLAGKPARQHQALDAPVDFRLHEHVVEGVAEHHRAVGRQGPGGGGPDRDAQRRSVCLHARDAGKEIGGIVGGETHVDGNRGLVLVFDFRLRQGRPAVQAPVDRLLAAIDVPAGVDPGERPDLVGLVARRHGQVRPLPLAQHPKPPEVLALAFDLAGRIAPAGFAKGRAVQRGGFMAQFPLHPHFDRQAVAIPARNVRRVVAVEDLRLHDEVLEHLVVGMADVDRAVGVRRTVQQRELLPPGHVLADPPVAAAALPLAKHFRLAARQVGAHRKSRTREVQGVAVIGHAGV